VSQGSDVLVIDPAQPEFVDVDDIVPEVVAELARRDAWEHPVQQQIHAWSAWRRRAARRPSAIARSLRAMRASTSSG
jgi:hypothetical protein